MLDAKSQAKVLKDAWDSDSRWKDVLRPYEAEDVVKLRGSVQIEHTLAKRGAEKLWNLINTEEFVPCLGALTGGQAVQQVKAGIKAIYLSGWQVAADGNTSETMYPDQSLYAVNSVPTMVARINNAFQRADQIQWQKGGSATDFFAPIVADAEAGFGGVLNAFELMKGMIKAGASGVHFEDQLASVKKCGHMGGKVLVPTEEAIHKLVAARLASDTMNTPTVLMARTDANAAALLTNDFDERDAEFVTGERTPEGFFRITGGLDCAIARGIAYAKYADLIWCETDKPDIDEAKRFADAIKKVYPEKMLAYNCSPSFNWKKHLDDSQISNFQKELGAMDYKFQFITLAGFHNLNLTTKKKKKNYALTGMSAYANLQEEEFAKESEGYTAIKHQREVGVSYFDKVSEIISSGESSTTAMQDSTESEQF